MDTWQVPLTYALSRGGLTDLVSCLPAFSSFQTWMASLAFVRSGCGIAARVTARARLFLALEDMMHST